MIDTLVLATRNEGKVAELMELLAPYDITTRLVTEFTDAEPVEDGGSYIANATIKARAAATASGLPSLADDAGLEVDAMPDRFGVETAPDAAAMGGFPEAIRLIAAKIAGGAPDTARHHITFVIAHPDGRTEVAEAETPGRIVYPGRGTAWGFNAYFVPDGSDLTYAELIARDGTAAKSRISPRAAAMAKLFPQRVP